MKRSITGLVLALVVAGLVAPASGAPRQRVESVAYERASGIHLLDVAWIEVDAGELPQAAPLTKEKLVSVSITDDSGRPVGAAVHQGDAELGTICGQTETPLMLVSRKPVHVHIFSGPGCDDVSAPTTGTVEFTFTR